MAISSMSLAASLSKMLESLIASMATRTMSALSAGVKNFTCFYGRKEGSEDMSHECPGGAA